MSRSLLLRFRKFFNSVLFSVLFLVIVIGGLGYMAYMITDSVQARPDFGGIMTIRQADLGIGTTQNEKSRVTLQKLNSIILKKDLLESLAFKYQWDISYEDMLKCIDVKERLANQNSFIIMVNSQDVDRSLAIARELSQHFLNEYQKEWKQNSYEKLKECDRDINACEIEIARLKNLKNSFDVKKGLQPLNTEIEMTALNEQLLQAQNQFLAAYGAFMSRLEQIRFDAEMSLALAKQEHTPNSMVVKSLQRKLADITAQCKKNKNLMTKQMPNIYSMEAEYPKLVGVPMDIIFFYENIQNLQSLKLALMIDSIIENKEQQLISELKKKTTIERLLQSNSADVFIREGN